jgi:hypothetical protein
MPVNFYSEFPQRIEILLIHMYIWEVDLYVYMGS